MKWLKLIFIMLAIYSSPASAFFKATNVGAIEISGLTKYAGKNLSVFYVSGRGAYFATVGHTINVNKIMSIPFTTKIDANGNAMVPSTSVPRSGFTVFNNVVFVIHDQKTHYIQNHNPRSKRPNDPRLPSLANGDSDWSQVSANDYLFLKKLHKKSSKLRADADGSIRLNFGY